MACLGKEVVKEKTFYLHFIQVAIHFTIAKCTRAYKVQASSGTNIASLIFTLELNLLKKKEEHLTKLATLMIRFAPSVDMVKISCMKPVYSLTEASPSIS